MIVSFLRRSFEWNNLCSMMCILGFGFFFILLVLNFFCVLFVLVIFVSILEVFVVFFLVSNYFGDFVIILGF